MTFFEGKVLRIEVERDYGAGVFAPFSLVVYFRDRVIAGIDKIHYFDLKSALQILVSEIERWRKNPKVWELIKEDVKEIKKRYGV